ncbi:MAG: hypothetical protein AAFX93_18175 [Verrucomicrobiota bacterium]
MPNATAIDAAAVGIFWYLAYSQALGLNPGIVEALILGMSIWLVYLGDRWLDVRVRHWVDMPTYRHRFVARWRRTLFLFWICILGLNVGLAFFQLTKPQLLAGLVVLSASILYTVGIQKQLAWLIPKEGQIALIFSAGIGLFFVGRPMPLGDVIDLGLGLACFSLVCFANCGLIARWEVSIDEQLERRSIARSIGDRANQLRVLAWIALIACTISGMFFQPIWWLAIYTALLLAVDRYRFPANLEDRRALADGLLALLGLLAWIFT